MACFLLKSLNCGTVMSDITKARLKRELQSRLVSVDGGKRNGMEASGDDPLDAPAPASGTLPATASPPVRGGHIFTAGHPSPAGYGNLLPGLELIRGLACLQVFFSHIFIVLMFHGRAQLNPAFWKLAVLDWSYESVMVFFVLSGFVIALSQQRKQQDFLAFMRSRFRRLEPLYLVAIAFSFGLENFFYSPPAIGTLVGHLFYVQGSNLAPVFNVNTPLWSLSYEFFFYLVFACTIGRNQKLLRRGWFVLGLGAMALKLAGYDAPGWSGFFQNILSLSPVWLLGTFLTGRNFCARATLAQKFMLVGMLPLATRSLPFLGIPDSPAHSFIMALLVAPLLHAAAQAGPPQTRSRPLIWSAVAGLFVTFTTSFLIGNPGRHQHAEMVFAILSPFLFFCLVPLYRLLRHDTPFFSPRVVRLSLWLGKMSYAIYIIHFPVLLALAAVLRNPLLLVAADILVVIPLAWGLTYYLEPVLAAIFDRLWPAAGGSALDLKRRLQTDPR
jgi:peptidoglycan/LPS O-acetylase OafA/YrhL